MVRIFAQTKKERSMDEIKERIKKVIKDCGYTYQEVADKMEVSLQNIKNTLNSSNPISTKTASRIAEAIGVDMWELFISREEVIGNQLTALVEHNGTHYKATSLEELEMVVETIKSKQKRTE